MINSKFLTRVFELFKKRKIFKFEEISPLKKYESSKFIVPMLNVVLLKNSTNQIVT